MLITAIYIVIYNIFDLFSRPYLDTNKVDLLVNQIDKAIREFLPTEDERYVQKTLEGLDELARVLVYLN